MVNLTKSLDALLISKVRIKALKYFLFNPDTPIHLRGAVRELKEEINAVRRELTRLEAIDFIKSEMRGNRKYFLLNPEYQLLDELLAIFHKVFGLGGLITNNLEKLGDVKFAILTSTYINNQPNANSVDLVMIGDIKLENLAQFIDETEKKMNRQINYTVLKENELVLRKKRRDAFIMEVLVGKKILLFGNSDELAK